MSHNNGNHAGNGSVKTAPRESLIKRTETSAQEDPANLLMPLPPWLQALRDAMGTSIQSDDLKEIMQMQVKKAKEGDMKAAQFVMNQAHKLVAAEQKRVTIVQNNYYDTPADGRPDTPLQPGDGREAELRKLTARAGAGQPLTGRPEDRRVNPVSDAEEKEMRRRQQAADTEAEGDPLRD